MLFNQLSVLSFVLLGSPRCSHKGDGLVSANIGKLRGMTNKKVQIHVDCWLWKFGMVFFCRKYGKKYEKALRGTKFVVLLQCQK